MQADGYPVPVPRYKQEVDFSETHNLAFTWAEWLQRKTNSEITLAYQI